ncbi:MAG: hypothetical protein HG453_002400 [Clostridiales bacterium]|nr:hypothetical protein [Clostridiales bacterium]
MVLNIFKVIIISIFGSIYQSIGIGVYSYKYLVDLFIRIGNISDNFEKSLFIAVQFGVALAILLLFYNRIWPFKIIKDDDGNKIGINVSRCKLLFKIFVSIIVYVLIVQFYSVDFSEFLNEKIINIILLVCLGVLIIFLQNKKTEDSRINNLFDISWKEVFIITICNIVFGFIFHDTSLLTIMIVIGLLFGISKKIAFEYGLYMILFSFLINFFINVPLFYGLNLNEWILLLICLIFSFITSVIIIRGTMDFLKKGDYRFIGIFKILIGFYYLILLFLKLI